MVIGVPRHSVILRTLSLPRIQDVRELASVVHMQIGKDLPFRQEEAVIDFKVRAQTERSGKSQAGDCFGVSKMILPWAERWS